MSAAVQVSPLRVPFQELAVSDPTAEISPHADGTAAGKKPSDSKLGQDLQSTLHPSKDTREGATSALKAAEAKTGFCVALLRIIRQPDAPITCRLSGATYLKNFVKKGWSAGEGAGAENGSFLATEERQQIRSDLLDTLLCTDVAELRNMLAEVLRIVASADYPKSWPTLVPTLCSHMEKLHSEQGHENTPRSLENLLVAIHQLTRPFECFRNLTVAKEEAPAELEDLVQKLIVPLHANLFHPAVVEMTSSDSANPGALVHMRLVAKIFYRVTNCYLPTQLTKSLGAWMKDFLTLLEHNLAKGAAAATLAYCDDDNDDDDGVLTPKWKLQKRVLQTLLNFQVRHKACFKPCVPRLLKAVLGALSNDQQALLPPRIVSLCFDALSRCWENQSYRKLVQPHSKMLIRDAIFPVLQLSASDVEMWVDDEEEYISSNLLVDNVTSGFRDDLHTPRRSALNLLELMASTNDPMHSKAERRKARGKRGKGKDAGSSSSSSSNNGVQRSPFSEAFKFAESVLAEANAEGTDPKVREAQLYGVLLLIGALSSNERLSEPKVNARFGLLLRQTVVPACHHSAALGPNRPLVVANAQWVLGKFVGCMGEKHLNETLKMLLENLVIHDLDDDDDDAGSDAGGDEENEEDEEVETGSMKPVRVTAGSALKALIEERYEKGALVSQLSPLVQQLLLAAEYENELGSNNDAPLTLLNLVVSTAEEHVLPHAQAVAKVLIERLDMQIDDGDDLSMCTALEVLSMLTESLEAMESEGTEMAELSGWLCCALAPLLEKYSSKSASGGGAGDDEGTIYLPEMCQLLHYLFSHAGATPESNAVDAWALLAQFCGVVLSSADDMDIHEAPELWELLHDVVKKGARNVDNFTAGCAAAGGKSPCQALLQVALHGVRTGAAPAVKLSSKLLKYVVMAMPQGQPQPELAAVAAAAMEQLDDGVGITSRASPHLVLLLCHCLGATASPAEVLGNIEESGGVLTFLRAFSTEAVAELTNTNRRTIILSGMKLVELLHGSEHGSSACRRQLGGVLDTVFSLVEAVHEEEEEEEDDGEEEEEEEDEDEDEEEEEEDAFAFNEEEDEEDEEDADEEEDDEDDEEEEEEETEEEFLARYAQIAKDMEAGCDDDDDECDDEEDEDIMTEVLGDQHQPVDAKARFLDWFGEHRELAADIGKRKAVADFVARFGL